MQTLSLTNAGCKNHPAPQSFSNARRNVSPQGRKPQKPSKATESASKRGAGKKAVAAAAVPDVPKLKSEYGVDAWKQWIRWRQTQPNIEKPRYGLKPLTFPTNHSQQKWLSH